MRGAGERTYFEDLFVGLTYQTPALTLTEAHVSQFLGLAGDWPDQPANARQAVPDLLPACLSSGLGWRIAAPPLAIIAFMGLDWSSLGPLRVGDTIRCRATIVNLRALRDAGFVIEEREILDQRGQLAQRIRITLLVARRPSKEP